MQVNPHCDLKQQAAKADRWLRDLTAVNAERIAATWQSALEAEGDLAEDFYREVFAASPEVVQLFPGDMAEQQKLLTLSMSQSIAMVGQPDSLILLMHASGVRHAHYGVEESQFPIIGKALVATVARRADPDFTVADRELWEGFYAAMSALMRKGLAEATER